jgi:hypothetical protein
VDKNGEDPTAPDDPDHLMSYQIRRTSVRFEGGLDEVVIDQFARVALHVCWSATSHSIFPNFAWNVGFDSGNVLNGNKNFDSPVRAVRGGS